MSMEQVFSEGTRGFTQKDTCEHILVLKQLES